MSGALSWAAIREADRLDREYARRRRERDRLAGRSSPVGRVVLAALAWGTPVAPLVAAAFGADVASVWWAAGVGIVAVAPAIAKPNGVVRRDPFEQLRFPSHAALFVARFLRALPWLTWAGVCLGALRALQLMQAGLGARTCAATALLLACAPAHALAARCAFVAAESIGRSTGSTPRRVALGIAAVCAAIGLGGFAVGPIFKPAIIALVFLYPRERGLARFAIAPKRLIVASLHGAWLFAASSAAVGSVFVRGPRSEAFASAALLGFAAWSVVATPFLVRWAMAQPPAGASRPEEASGSRDAPMSAGPLRRPAPGGGLWRAARRRHAALLGRAPSGPWRWTAWTLHSAWAARGAVLAGLTVMCAAEPEPLWKVLAACAALLAPSLLPAATDGRLFLLGSDLRTQDRSALRGLLVLGATPAVAAALAVAAWTGFDASALGATAIVTALLLLRAGWSGLAGASSALAHTAGNLAFVTTAALVAPDSERALPWAAAIAAVGAIGIAMRLSRTEQWHRDRMRARQAA